MDVTIKLAPTAQAPRTAREIAVRTCLGWHLNEAVAPAALVTGDLVARSVVQGAQDIHVTVSRHRSRVRVLVSDDVRSGTDRGGGLDEKKRADLLERFELDPSNKTRTYSKGNRQKVAVVAAFASRASLYLLDEPTSGLDPLMEAQFQRCVHEAKAEGATVLLSSHILAEAEALSDRISIIKHGVVVQSGTLAELRHFTRTTVIAETDLPPTRLGDVPGVHNIELLDGRAVFDVDSDHLDGAVAALSALGIRSLTAHPPTLEELFMRQYGEELAGAPHEDPT